MFKLYYPRLDLLKFLCCVGIVSIHTKLTFYLTGSIINELVCFFAGMCVPLFFMVSSFLLWDKLTFSKEDGPALGHFVKRLFILYLAWSVLLFPTWFIGFYQKYPDEWLLLLSAKVFITGMAHGSLFIVSLIQGVFILYLSNRYLGKILTTLISAFVSLYVISVFHGSPDYLHVYYNYKIFNIWFSPFFAMVFIQMGYLVRLLVNSKCKIEINMGGVMTVCIILAFVLRKAEYVGTLLQLVTYISIMLFCSKSFAKGLCRNYSMLRKMSIIIYFTHFVFAIVFRELAARGFFAYEFGLREFGITLFSSCLIALFIVLMSKKVTIL